MAVREQIRSLKNICCSSRLENLSQSILPLLTKCKPTDHDLDLDEKRATLSQQFTEEIDAEMLEFDE